LSGNILPDEKRILISWLSESAENKSYLEQLRNIWQVANPAFLPEDIDIDQAQSRVMRKINGASWKARPFIIWWQRLAAVLIIPVILLTAYQFFKGTSQDSATAWQEILSPYGMHSKITLPDGSAVWLNSGSQLRYPVKFTGQERYVVLTGEAFFKVQSDKKHPFIVETKKIKVAATGTEFNIEAYSNDSITAVTLLSGTVDVIIGDKKQENLHPNQRLVFKAATHQYELVDVSAQYWCLWKDGILAFRNEPLEDVFKRIGRTFNVDIDVKDKAVGQQLYRATFQEESLEEILRLLKLSAPIQYKRIGRVQQDGNLFNKDRIEVYSSK
jgi:transmembrane sensor